MITYDCDLVMNYYRYSHDPGISSQKIGIPRTHPFSHTSDLQRTYEDPRLEARQPPRLGRHSGARLRE